MPPRENQCRPRRSRGWHWFSRVDNFPCYPLVQSIFIILYWMQIHRLHYVWLQKKPDQVKIWDCISYSVNSNAHTTPVVKQITRCHVLSRVRAWFHDFAGDIDFYQMSLSQSESTILHESIISWYIYISFEVLDQKA